LDHKSATEVGLKTMKSFEFFI